MSYTNKEIWKVSYPIMFSLLAQNVISITDTAFLGHVGEVELGGAALGGLWYYAIFMLGFGFSTGAQILIARRNGDRNIRQVASYFVQGNFFLFFLALAMIGLSHQFASLILSPAIQSQAVLDATLEFIEWRMYGLLFAFPQVMFRALFVGITRTKVLTISSVVMAVINIFLDYVLIFGAWGFPELGIKGAAVASVIAELVSTLFMLVYTLAKLDLRAYGFYLRVTYGLNQLVKVLSISVWTMIQYFGAIATWFIFFLATERLGERSLAVSNIVRSLSSILFMPVSAYGTTCNTLVSNLMGEGKASEVPALVLRIIKQCAYIIAPLMVLLCVFPTFFLQIYSQDKELILASVNSLLVLVSCYFVATPGAVLFQFVSGTGNTRSALWIEVMTLTFYMLYIAFLVYCTQASVAVYWASEMVYWGIMLVFSIWYMKKANWRSRVI